MGKLSLDTSRCMDGDECERGKECLRNDSNGRVYSYFLTDGFCNKSNNFKMIKLPREKENGECCEQNRKKNKTT